ncbi:MAG: alpha/beta fold hydrolase [Hyphomicrobiaceae bacterium]
MIRLIALALFFCAFALTPVSAQTQDDTTDKLIAIGNTDVKANQKSVVVDVSKAEGTFKALRVKSKRGAVAIRRIIVTYADGRVHYEDRGVIRLSTGERTREIDPQDDAGRFVDTVEIVFDATALPRSRRKAASLEVLGLQSLEGSVATRARRTDQGVAERRSRKKKKSRRGGGGGGGGFSTRSMTPPAATVDKAAPATSRYAEVEVYFGTTRQEGPPRKSVAFKTEIRSFGAAPARAITYGKAIVTVPREGRDRGQIPRPEWDLVLFTIPWGSEDPAQHFAVFEVGTMSPETFFAATRAHLAKAKTFKDQAFVFVHGFNNSFDDALYRAAQITFDLDFDGIPLLFSWPSMGTKGGYGTDRERIDLSRNALREFLERVSRETGAKRIHLIAHSMGSVALLRVLEDFARQPTARRAIPQFGEVIFAAPDVTRDNFEDIAQRIKGVRSGMTLLASANDKALSFSEYIRRARLGDKPAGYVPPGDLPLVTDGVDTIDISAIEDSLFGLNHATFADREVLIKDIAKLFLESTRLPPDKRLPQFEPHILPSGGTFWLYRDE